MSFWVYLGRVAMGMLWWMVILFSSGLLYENFYLNDSSFWMALFLCALMIIGAKRMIVWWDRIHRKPKLVAAIDTLVKEYEKELGESDITWLSPHEVNGELYFVEIYKK